MERCLCGIQLTLEVTFLGRCGVTRVATKEREEIKRTTKQKMARRHNKEGGNHLEQESNRQRTREDIDGGVHPAVAGQSLEEKGSVT